MIIVVNKRSSQDKLKKDYPGAAIIDVTSSSPTEFVRLSPFFPHGGIPVPGSNLQAACVEGVWQGLKVFAGQDIDMSCFSNDTMKNLKRTVRTLGAPKGHRFGLGPDSRLLSYFDARMLIYVPTYLYLLQQVPSVQPLLQKIQELSQQCGVILLDYNTNSDVRDLSRPLSHAGLVKHYLDGTYPQNRPDLRPFTAEESKALKNAEKQRNQEFKKWCRSRQEQAQNILEPTARQGFLEILD